MMSSNIFRKASLDDADKKLENELEQSKNVIETLQSDYSKLEREIANRESFLSQFQ